MLTPVGLERHFEGINMALGAGSRHYEWVVNFESASDTQGCPEPGPVSRLITLHPSLKQLQGDVQRIHKTMMVRTGCAFS
jgi:hypothetical protein